jgi:hypothetical protein
MIPVDRVLVISVGLEQYEFGPKYDLPGATEAACRFVQWALDREIDPKRVWLGCTPGAVPDKPKFDRVTKIGTREADLKNAFRDASEFDADLLLVFWCGHGVMNESGERALFTSDATEKWPNNLSVDEMLKYLRSDAVRSLKRQFLLIDSCANFVQGMNRMEKLPHSTFPSADPGQVTQQFSFFSASQGQIAEFDKIERQAIFSETVLEWLEEHATEELPPDTDRLKSHVTAVFEKLRTNPDFRQIPATLELKDYPGDAVFLRRAGGIPMSGPSLEAVASLGMTAQQTRRCTEAVESLSPVITQTVITAALAEVLFGGDGTDVADLGLQDLVARVLGGRRSERVFNVLKSHAVTQTQKIAVSAIEEVWKRQEKIAQVEGIFSGVKTQHVVKAFWWAAPDVPDGGPEDLDDALDRVGQYGLDSLPLYRFVAALECSVRVTVPDLWFGLSVDRLNALRADAAAAMQADPPRLVVDLQSSSEDPEVFMWPKVITVHRYVPSRRDPWLPKVEKECKEATPEGVQAAVNEMLETADPRCELGFILPRAAFDEIPESWAFGTPLTEPTPHWHDRPTVVHSADRFSVPTARIAWTSKAKAIKARLVGHLADVKWLEHDDPAKIRLAIRNTESPCYGLAFAPQEFHGILRKDPIIAAIAAGAPYVIWVRQEPNDWPTAKTRLERLVTHGAFDDLPRRLHKLREDETEDLRDSVRLMWDHPDVLPPRPELSDMTNGAENHG